MPTMDGMTATRHIRRLPPPAGEIPIVAMTANVYAEQIAAFRDAGMNDHIGKPFRRDELRAVLNRWTAEAVGTVPDGGHSDAPDQGARLPGSQATSVARRND